MNVAKSLLLVSGAKEFYAHRYWPLNSFFYIDNEAAEIFTHRYRNCNFVLNFYCETFNIGKFSNFLNAVKLKKKKLSAMIFFVFFMFITIMFIRFVILAENEVTFCRPFIVIE